MDRVARLLSTSNHASHILEVGAGYSPIAPKSAGWKSRVIDHASQADLRAKYTGSGVDLTAIEPVDFVWQGGALHDAVPPELHGTFDTLIASHVIEHFPDMVGFFQSASHLLKPNGIIALAVPDRRYCFDYFKPTSNTGDVLEAHAAGRTRHSLRTIWNHSAFALTMRGLITWGQDPVGQPAFITGFEDARAALAGFNDDPNSPYTDCHTWFFTPAAFALIILELGQLGVIDWRLDTVHGPAGCEFIALLRRGREADIPVRTLDGRRLNLMRRQMLESLEQINFAIIGGAFSDGPAADTSEETRLLGDASLQLAGLVPVGTAPPATVRTALRTIANAYGPLRFLARATRGVRRRL